MAKPGDGVEKSQKGRWGRVQIPVVHKEEPTNVADHDGKSGNASNHVQVSRDSLRKYANFSWHAGMGLSS